MMSWMFGKKNTEKRDIEKGSRSETETSSSFGSISDNGKTHIIILPPKQAHLPDSASPTNPTFVNSSNSPGFTSSFPVSERSSNSARSFVQRHAFVLILLLAILLTSSLSIMAILLTREFARLTANVTRDQVSPSPSFATFAPAATSG